MRLEKNFYGKIHTLIVIRHEGELMFEIDNKIFKTLTAAARHLYRDDTKQISGPAFWGAPKADT